ncbi:PLD nuclease N-terminal domain-containing protein [Rhodococcus sp. NPDC058505]|uniref:PLD nuclease N-terminal domain-containing protein n=1 Tax=Rhodococcus sp. NPDC058505 TaxID=3346531 RepID=UPI003655BA0E
MPYLGLIVMVLWVGCLVDVICADEHRVRHLPKILWLIVVILVPLLGSVLWLLLGRPQGGVGVQAPARVTGFPEYDRPGRQAGVSSESDEEFLRRCRERAEEQRRVAKEQQRRSANERHRRGANERRRRGDDERHRRGDEADGDQAE